MLKTISKNLASHARLYFIFLFFIFSYMALMRVGFTVWNNSKASEISFWSLIQAIYLGFKFDFRVAQVFSLPFILLGLVPFYRPLKYNWFKIIFQYFYLILFFFITIIYFVDFGFYSYLSDRVNSSVLNFLDTWQISANMVWESYPVIWLSFIVLILLIIFNFFLRVLISSVQQTRDLFSIKYKFILNTGLILFFLLGAYGKFSRYPLRWSEAYFDSNPVVAHFAINPIHHLVDTLKFRKKNNYNLEVIKNNYTQIANFLGVPVEEQSVETLNFKRHIPENLNAPLKGFNVVVIMMESLSFNKTSLSENPLDPSPNLKKLAEQSIYFKKHFTPTVATARGVFASIISNPDMTPGSGSSSRNPMLVNQHSIVDDFENYEKFYFLGGSANWGNIRGMFTNNIRDIQIYEEGSYESPVVDVWGISDIDLFLEADKVLANKKTPFFAFIQTSGFHRPFTIPDDNHGFQKKSEDIKDILRYGFVSLEEYNSMRLQDHALNIFIEKTKKSGYFDNTLFVIYGDHGVSTLVSDHMPKNYLGNDLVAYHVPLLFLAPKVLTPKVIEKPASQVDIMPTIASLIGVEHTIQTMGRDLFSVIHDNNAYAFFYSWFANPVRFGLLNDKFVLAHNAGKASLQFYQGDQPENEMTTQYPEEFERMKNMAEGIYETARYMMYFNPKMSTKEKK